MKFNLLGFLKRKPKAKEHTHATIIKIVGKRKFEIVYDISQISDDEANKIIEIVCSELNKTLTNITGYTIARRIAKEISTEINATSVSGGTDGDE